MLLNAEDNGRIASELAYASCNERSRYFVRTVYEQPAIIKLL